MNDLAIKVQNLKKKYKLYDYSKHRLFEAFHPLRKKYHKEFYALDDLSFEVRKGETLGVVGRNGSGKSTLLQILTGVLTPTSGLVEVNGRVSALLELGAGFNPQLSGIDNVYFQGRLTGFSRKDMDERIDDILTFADIGEFVYQPVKMYSSGMYVRLAFAVAVMVDPDILIVDEALAVGDIKFQQKCIRKMKSFIESGKTVIFVTHDIGTVNNFCSKTLWLNDGKMKDYGISENVTKKYMSFMVYGMETGESVKKALSKNNCDELTDNETSDEWIDTTSCEFFGSLDAVITGVKFINNVTGKRVSSLEGGERVSFFIRIKAKKDVESPGIGVLFKDRVGNGILGVGNYIYNVDFSKWNAGSEMIVKYEFNIPFLLNGFYSIVVAISDGNQFYHEQLCWLHDVYTFEVISHNLGQQIGNFLFLEKDNVSLECSKV